MKYLTIDTTSKITALALGEDAHLVGEGFIHTMKTHSERLVPMLDQLLKAAAWQLGDLDFIGVVRGPGSFTGIRIGIATAQGLAQVLKIPLVGVLSLDTLAYAGFGRGGDIVPILDARKNEWYTARYRWERSTSAPVCLTAPRAVAPQDWLTELSQLSEINEQIIFVGDAAPKFEAYLSQELGNRALVLPPYESLPRGAYAVQAVWKSWQEHKTTETVEPYYIRLSEAETNWAKKEETRGRDGHG